LRMARELKEAANAAEEDLRSSKRDKKARKDTSVDAMIDELFFFVSDDGDVGVDPPQKTTKKTKKTKTGLDELVSKLERKKPSTEKLLDVVVRLHERELSARGANGVENENDGGTGGVSRTEIDAAELSTVSGLANLLVDACAAIDEKWFDERREKFDGQSDPNYRNHAESEHYTSGETGRILRDKHNELKREHDERFLKRQEEYYRKITKKQKTTTKTKTKTKSYDL